MWWMWVVGGLLVWLVLATAVALVIGRGIRLADRHAAGEPAGRPLDAPAVSGAAVLAARPRRRVVPLPPVGVALAALAVTLETVGFLVGMSGSSSREAQLFSMDAPLSLPRMFIAALFAAAALAAVAGAGRLPGRRAWWLGVALVAGAVAAVKAGGTVHTDAMGMLQRAGGSSAAVVVSALVAAAVGSALWFASRGERRDRRRVLGSLALYAGASIALSAVSGAVPGSAHMAATFVEESGEALAGVAFLMAVLVGVAPRLVLPADWAMRRAMDAHTLELRESRPATEAAPG